MYKSQTLKLRREILGKINRRCVKFAVEQIIGLGVENSFEASKRVEWGGLFEDCYAW